MGLRDTQDNASMNATLPRIIAICGLKRSGKDTLADAICQSYGFEKLRISANLKEVMRVLFDFTEDQLETDLKDDIDGKWGVTPRKLMQFIGTEIMQHEIQKVIPNVGRHFWIKKVRDEHIEKYPAKKFIISDLRFLHEYELLQKYKPYIIRVERNCVASQCAQQHSSETEFKSIPYDKLFNNNGTLYDIEQQVKTMFNQT